MLAVAVDAAVLAAITVGEFDEEEAVRLLQLGMACSNPNPGERRPSMVDTVKIIGKSLPPPDVTPSKPPMVWPP